MQISRFTKIAVAASALFGLVFLGGCCRRCRPAPCNSTSSCIRYCTPLPLYVPDPVAYGYHETCWRDWTPGWVGCPVDCVETFVEPGVEPEPVLGPDDPTGPEPAGDYSPPPTSESLPPIRIDVNDGATVLPTIRGPAPNRPASRQRAMASFGPPPPQFVRTAALPGPATSR